MQRPVSFRGKSGRTYAFRLVEAHGNWMGEAGVALFAAPDGYAWRVIRIAEMTGRPDDVQPLWAQADAARYGGDAVLVLAVADPVRRRKVAEDLEAGFSPVWTGTRGGLAVGLGLAA